MIDARSLADALTKRFEVAVVASISAESAGQRITFRPQDLPSTQGFSVDVLIAWRAIEAEFSPAAFALPLLQLMEHAPAPQRGLFRAFVQAAISDRANVIFTINGEPTNPTMPDSWPSNWRSVSLSMRKSPILIDPANDAQTEALALTWSGRILGSVLSLLPLEPVEPPEPALDGEAEGASRQVLVTRYERSPINRAACVELQGARCKVCGFDFGTTYGAIGKGFIEVHHLEMVSTLMPGTVLNPAIDLVPVCANCHAMLHRQKPPFSIQELRGAMEAAKSFA